MKNNDKAKVELSLKEENNCVELSIQHLNSTYKKSLESTEKRPRGQTYSSLITLINGVCDLYLHADFGGKYAEMNIWNGKDLKVKKLKKFKGVEHILKFQT